MRRRYSFATVLVGKNSLRSEGLARILRSANFRILASVSSADDLLSRKLQSCQLLFLIVHNGDDFDSAIEQIERFRNLHPDGRIAVIADHYQLKELVSALRAGATGYFVDVMSCDVFIKSIELLMLGETVLPPAFLSFALDSKDDLLNRSEPHDDEPVVEAPDDRLIQQLSPREKSILRCLIEGDSNKCIARKIDIAEATVKVHIKAILRKIRVQNRTQAAIWGINNRSLVPQVGKPPQLTSEADRPSLPPPYEINNIKLINGAPAAEAAIAESFPVTHANGHIRKCVGLKMNGALRMRK